MELKKSKSRLAVLHKISFGWLTQIKGGYSVVSYGTMAPLSVTT